jgi:hypothetical protein
VKRLGLRRLAAGPFGIMLLLILGTGAAHGQEPDCELHVEPPTAAAGSTFVLRGSGYTPTEVTLQRQDIAPVTVELDLPEDEAFEIPISSQPGDEGLWTATVSDAARDCTAAATFRVTLLDTATGEDARTILATGAGGLPIVMYLLVILVGFAGGRLLARQSPAG